ncbi:MAG TPA: AarF/UbiB family protein [Gemmatimonadaceae bacterium]|jgi:predicted unusual protein kinase regulating ubiquinone biosynthesis (AarF/ABC1/UbiB family)|nr:AarF/UbiB family protein [Gemmatimonadaceae bacterium]
MILAPRYLPRLAATIGLFTRYGLTDFAKQQGLQSIAHEPEPGEDFGGSPDKARAFRKRLVELGPAYIKLGQVLSTRPDLLPPSYIEELEQLQDDVDPIPVEQVVEAIEEELGARLSKLFATFELEPLGTASLGQVHAAELRDGRPVVVKVQRPNIRNLLADDVAFFHELASFLSEHTEAGARIDMVGVVQQLEQALSDELDYRIEARNAMAFRRTLAEFPRILVPRVIEAYTTDKVLTTERIRGTKIDSVSPLTRLEHDFSPVADELTRAYLKQITIDGHFHADPHPGNVFVVLPSEENPPTPSEVKATDRRAVQREAATPLARIENAAQREAAPQPPEIDVKIAMIDFGMTARLSATLREHIVRLLLDLADNRGDDAAEAMIEIGNELPGFDREAYVREIAGLMARNYNLSIGELDTGKVLYELINISYQRGLRLPAELTLLAKTLFNLDTVTKALDPTYSPIPTIREFGNEIAAERARRELNPRRLYQLATEGSDLLMALPHRLDIITQRMAANEFETRIDIPQLTLMMQALQKVANRVFSGLVLAGLLIASAMLIQVRRALGTAGFILAGVIGVWMVLSILWSDREKSRQ